MGWVRSLVDVRYPILEGGARRPEERRPERAAASRDATADETAVGEGPGRAPESRASLEPARSPRRSPPAGPAGPSPSASEPSGAGAGARRRRARSPAVETSTAVEPGDVTGGLGASAPAAAQRAVPSSVATSRWRARSMVPGRGRFADGPDPAAGVFMIPEVEGRRFRGGDDEAREEGRNPSVRSRMPGAGFGLASAFAGGILSPSRRRCQRGSLLSSGRLWNSPQSPRLRNPDPVEGERQIVTTAGSSNLPAPDRSSPRYGRGRPREYRQARGPRRIHLAVVFRTRLSDHSPPGSVGPSTRPEERVRHSKRGRRGVLEGRADRGKTIVPTQLPSVPCT